MSLRKQILAGFARTARLLIVVAGSGIMGETLAMGNLVMGPRHQPRFTIQSI